MLQPWCCRCSGAAGAAGAAGAEGGDVFCGSTPGNRDGLEAVTGVPGHARAAPS